MDSINYKELSTRKILADVTPRKIYKDRALLLQDLAATYDADNILQFL